jgi:hypothetical protein
LHWEDKENVDGEADSKKPSPFLYDLAKNRCGFCFERFKAIFFEPFCFFFGKGCERMF